MAARLSDLSVALSSTIVSGPATAVAEAARVLGNMTRCATVRKHFCDSGGLKVIVQQLRSDDLELVAASCGILVNLLGDWERRACKFIFSINPVVLLCLKLCNKALLLEFSI